MGSGNHSESAVLYVKVGRDESLYSALKERWKGGDASFINPGFPGIGKIQRIMKNQLNPDASYYEGVATENILSVIPIIINNCWLMDLPEKKMQVNLFSEVHSDMDLIFIHFIFFFSMLG